MHFFLTLHLLALLHQSSGHETSTYLLTNRRVDHRDDHIAEDPALAREAFFRQVEAVAQVLFFVPGHR
jgi:hypothetical protein